MSHPLGSGQKLIRSLIEHYQLVMIDSRIFDYSLIAIQKLWFGQINQQ